MRDNGAWQVDYSLWPNWVKRMRMYAISRNCSRKYSDISVCVPIQRQSFQSLQFNFLKYFVLNLYNVGSHIVNDVWMFNRSKSMSERRSETCLFDIQYSLPFCHKFSFKTVISFTAHIQFCVIPVIVTLKAPLLWPKTSTSPDHVIILQNHLAWD